MKKYLILMFMMFSINILVKAEVHGFIPIDTLIINKNIYIKFKTPDILSNPLITAKQVNDIIYDCFSQQNVYDLSKRSNILYDDKDSSVKSYPCNEYITYKKYIYLKIK